MLGEGRFVEIRRTAEKALGMRHLPLDQFRAVESGNKFFALSLSNRAHSPHYTALEAEIEALKKALAKTTHGSVSLK